MYQISSVVLSFFFYLCIFFIAGSASTGIEAVEPEGEESEAAEKDGPNGRLQIIESQEEEIQYSRALPMTHFLRNCRFSTHYF